MDFLSGVLEPGLSLSREPRKDSRALHRNTEPKDVWNIEQSISTNASKIFYFAF